MTHPEPLPPPPSPALPPPAPDLLRREAGPLAQVLERLRRRAARLELSRALLWGATAAALVLFIAASLLMLKQRWARPAGWSFATLAFVALLGRGLWQARRARQDDRAAARALGRVAPRDASDLLSAVELAEHPDETSPGLVRAHLARMALVARQIDPRPALTTRPVQIAAGALAVAAIAHVVLWQAGGARAAGAYAYLAFRPSAEIAPLFAPEPIAGDVTLTYRYPAHQKREPRTVAGTAGDIVAPKGTVVRITARADRDVTHAFAVLTKGPGEAAAEPVLVPLNVDGRDLSGELLVTDPGEWRFRFTKPNGSVVAEGPPRPVSIEPDRFPEIRISRPESTLEVQGQETLTVEYSADDDYGLGEVTLVFSRGRGGQEERKVLQRPPNEQRRLRGETNWDLRPLNLRPGDRITYRLEVFDNDAVSGPKRGVSASQVLEVFSQTEHHRRILQKAEEQWERLLSGLGDRLEEPPAGDDGALATADWERRTAAKDQLLAQVAADLRTLSAELADDPRAPPEIGRALGHVGSRVGAAVQRTTTTRSALVRRPTPPAARHFRAALADEIREEEQGVLYLEDLMDRQRLLDLAEMARELQQGREELTRLVEQYKQAPNEETKRQLMGEVAALKQRLHELFRRMQELQQGIQDQHLNEEAAQLMDEGRDMLGQLDEIQKQLSEGNADEALQALEALQKQLEEMERSFNEGAGEVDEQAQRIGQELQKLASDLLDVEAEQQALKNQTDQMRQQARAEAEKKLRELGEQFVKKQRERARQAREALERVPQPLAEALAEDESLQGAMDRLQQLDQALESGDFDEALDQAMRALQQGQQLDMRLQAEAEMARRFPGYGREPQALDGAAKDVRQAQPPMREVVQDLEKLLKQTQPEMSPGDQQKLGEMTKKQENLQKRTEQLQQKLDELGEQMPIFGPQQGNLLKEAAQQMGEAQGALGEKNPRGASSRQGDALQKLQAFKEAMSESQQGGSSGGGIPMPFGGGGSEGDEGQGNGRGFRAQKVEIPTEPGQAPAEFRKDILDAMKDQAPDRYREQVRDYYEELVK